MRLKYKIGLLLVLVAIGISLMSLHSYALWVVELKGEEQIVEVGCFQVAYEEVSKSVSLKNTYPMSDTKGLTQVPYSFKITNTCTIDSSYVVTLNTLTTNGISKDKMKFAIYETNEAVPTTGINLATYATTDKINTDTTNLAITNLDESIILSEGSLKQNEASTYYVYLWIDEAAGNEVMGQKFEASIDVISTATTITESE